MNKPPPDAPGRLRTARDARKAFAQYQALLRGGAVVRAVIIAEKKNGNFEVLGQMTDTGGVAQLLMVAAEALAQVPEQAGEAPSASRAARPAGMRAGKPVFSVAAAWAEFWIAIAPEGAPPIQTREMRRGFYAGCRSMITTMMDMLEGGDDATPADLSNMESLWQELERFATDLEEGRA